jgi:hypothetical protein
LAVTGAASAIKPHGAKLTGTATPHELPASYRFVYGRTKAYGKSTPGRSAGMGAASVPTPATLSNLLPNTRYHYRLVVTNPDGTARGADRSFKTRPAN